MSIFSITILIAIPNEKDHTAGFSPVRSKTITVNCLQAAMGEENDITEFEPKVYPNPTTGKITLVFNSTLNEKYSVKITDIVGKPILNKEGISTTGINSIQLDLTNSSKGVYFLKLQKGDDKQIIKGILVQ